VLGTSQQQPLTGFRRKSGLPHRIEYNSRSILLRTVVTLLVWTCSFEMTSRGARGMIR